jgi:ribosomal protein S9
MYLINELINLFVFYYCKSFQIYAHRLGISKALTRLANISDRSEDRKKLRMNGFLTRNSLCKERRSSCYINLP